jgi:hypothetical protein
VLAALNDSHSHVMAYGMPGILPILSHLIFTNPSS